MDNVILSRSQQKQVENEVYQEIGEIYEDHIVNAEEEPIILSSKLHA
jgi:hypothetical protein